MFWNRKSINEPNSLSSHTEITDVHSPFMPDFSDDTKQAIINSIESCLEKGFATGQIVEKVSPLVPKGSNVEDIVRTESVFIYAKKTYNFAISSNAIATEWQHIPNRKYNRKTKEYETLEDECTENESCGGRYLGDKYPSGHLIPPAHIGCRCGIRVMYENDSGLAKLS